MLCARSQLCAYSYPVCVVSFARSLTLGTSHLGIEQEALHHHATESHIRHHVAERPRHLYAAEYTSSPHHRMTMQRTSARRHHRRARHTMRRHHPHIAQRRSPCRSHRGGGGSGDGGRRRVPTNMRARRRTRSLRRGMLRLSAQGPQQTTA